MRFLRFLHSKWPWAYRKLRDFRVWFFEMEDDHIRKYSVQNETQAFARMRTERSAALDKPAL